MEVLLSSFLISSNRVVYNDMDLNAPLFLAHQSGRNAVKCFKKRAFDEAIECHLNATLYLQQAMTLVTFNKSLESLQLQKNYHLSQANIIRARKSELTLMSEQALEKKRKMEERKWASTKKDEDMRFTLLRAMDNTEELLGQLYKSTEIVEKKESDFCKLPKSDKTVIEELKTVNAQLRILVNSLFEELVASREEVDMLRFKLQLYTDRKPIPELPPLELPEFELS